MTELAENNAALEAEETNGAQAEAAETTEVQEETAQPVAVSENEGTPAVEAVAAEAVLPARDADGFSSAVSDGEGLQRKHVPGGVGYEVIFAVRTGDQKLVEDSSRRVRALIEESLEGAVDNVRTSEVRRFAYPIKKQSEGVYVVLNARFKPEQTGELDRFFKLDENVLRHMLLKEDR